MGGNGFLPRASEKLLPTYSSGMYLTMLARSSTTWPSPSMILCFCSSMSSLLVYDYPLTRSLRLTKSSVWCLESRIGMEPDTLTTLLLCVFPHLLLCERIFFAQRLPVRSNLFAVVFDFLRNDSPGGAQRPRGAVAGFIDG